MKKSISVVLMMMTLALAGYGQTITRGGLTQGFEHRPAIQRDSGHTIRPDLKTPISITSAASGYPEIAPGSYAIVSAPINRIGNGWAQTTQLDGVSVEIDGTACLLFQLWKDGGSIIAPENLKTGGTLNVLVTTPEGRYHGKVRVHEVAPGIVRGWRAGSFQTWPVGLYRTGITVHDIPSPITEQPIPPTRGERKTIVKVLAAGFRRAHSVEVFVDAQLVPLIGVFPFFLPGQEEVAFELPEWLWGEDRLVEVKIVADGQSANPFWLRLPSASDANQQ